MVNKVSSELLPLTRELARRFAEMKPVPGERPLRPSRVKHFEELLRQHLFYSPNWAQVTIEQEGKEETLRADGQHTSQVLAACDDATFPSDLNVTITTYRINPSDLANLFDLFDNPISARTNTDKMGVFVADYEALTGIDRGFLAKAARGIDFYLREAKGESADGVLPWRMRLFPSRDHGLYFRDEANQQWAIWLYQWREAKHSWMISKPGIVAEMYVDWRQYPMIAGEFWGQVFTESNPDPNDDTRELASTLKDWARRQPAMKQDKFRARARKIWERYRRHMAQSAVLPAA
jgi:hypothetical protein